MSQIVRSAITSVFLAIPGSNLVGRYNLTPYTSLQKIISIPFIVNKISLLVSSTYGTITFFTSRMFFDYRVASLSSTHAKTSRSDVIGCREHRIRDHGSISTLLTKLLKTLTLRVKPIYIYRTIIMMDVADRGRGYRASFFKAASFDDNSAVRMNGTGTS